MWNAFMKQALAYESSTTTFVQPNPTNPVKPILAGNYLYNNQLHTILYYVDKSDPAGPPPVNPSADPQFNNWETALQTWAARNMPNYGSYNQLGSMPAGSTYPYAGDPGASAGTPTPTPSGAGAPEVNITSPTVGNFVADSVSLSANITGTGVSKISVLWNGADVKDMTGSFGMNYNFSWSFTPQSFNSQNLLEVDATDASGNVGKDSVIVYH
jgi:hypothetical protein